MNRLERSGSFYPLLSLQNAKIVPHHIIFMIHDVTLYLLEYGLSYGELRGLKIPALWRAPLRAWDEEAGPE
jgi:hypothetical protein